MPKRWKPRRITPTVGGSSTTLLSNARRSLRLGCRSSVQTPRKSGERVGDFKNAGQTWSLEPIAVNVHDFPGDADGRAVPYGVYDITTNRGFIYLGTSGDTPAVTQRGRTNVLRWLALQPSPLAPPARFELRDGQIYRCWSS